ncbi:MAG: hypothetical protein FWC03_04310 [Treponema sp.]|nr:hypothetical protein [Treponema sp.]
MKKIILAVYVLLLISCAGQQKILFRPEPGYNDVTHNNSVSINDIVETKEGFGNAGIPGWLLSFWEGGIEEVEKIYIYRNRYCFIGTSKGSNFSALNKWADNYSVVHDFPRMAAVRIERKMISAAALYPDDEYGSFFEIMVKKAFDAEFSDAILEGTYWIKRKADQIETSYDINETEDVYEFYVFISVSKTAMMTIVEEMITESLALVNPTRAQNIAIRRLAQNFFLEF